MPKSAREIMTGLVRKGFQRRDNDHTFFHLWVGGRKTLIYTKVSHGEKDIGDKLLGMMARREGWLSTEQVRQELGIK
jgi:hypothetical protein